MESAIQDIPHATTSKACIHCGTHFENSDATMEFCCNGCRFVYDLIHQEGLSRFYNLKGKATTQPVGGSALAPRSWAWLEREATRAEACDPPKLRLAIQGISCVGCVWLIENRFRNRAGALRITVFPSRGSIEFSWEKGIFDVAAFADEIASFGYSLHQGLDTNTPFAQDDLTRRMALCGAFAMNTMAFTLPRYLGMPGDFMFASLFETIAAFTTTLSLAVGGSYFIKRAWHSLAAGIIHIDTPIALGIAAAYGGSVVGWLSGEGALLYFDFVAVFIFLMLAGRRLQTSALNANRDRLPGAEIDRATYLNVSTGDTLSSVEIAKGTVYTIEPSQIVPVGSRVREHSATFSVESINGESAPRTVPSGGIVTSGARHLGASRIEVEAVEPWDASILCRLRKAKGNESAGNPALERILRVYLVLVIVLGIAGFGAWGIASKDLVTALQVMISVFVVSCPCALGVAIPLADDLATSRMERIGVYVRRAILWPKLLRVKKLLFDKTGTLTLERPQLENNDTLTALPATARAALRTMVECSLHPVCRTLAESLITGATIPVFSCEEVVGHGMRLVDSTGRVWLLGDQDRATGNTLFKRDGELLAEFRFRDAPRPGTLDQIRKLHDSGRSIHILSGDAQGKVDSLSEALELPLDRAIGELSPAEKAEAVIDIGGDDALYLGDGANDSLAVSKSLCSGASVSDVSLLQDKADFYVLGEGFNYLTRLFETARIRATAVRGAFAFALAYNVACLAIALSGNMNPLLAAILMPASSVVTVMIVRVSFRKA